ncbi:MAG: long-chain fatty acid--CoA ligase [Candidatus Lernaella stagnicola]|nr:long-chain fatty acid--CoA ligase [Candidatus Lernaella stagnicola]
MDQDKNLAHMFKTSATKFGNKPFMRFKKDGEWATLSYREVDRIVMDLAQGLLALGFKRGDRISLLSENRPYWAMMDLATQCLGGILATIYATNTPKECAYIINNSESRFVVVSNNNQLQKLISRKISLPTVEKIIIFDPIEGITDQDERVLSLKQLREMGRDYNKPEEVEQAIGKSTMDDVATLIYTSGTTGDPKGVMLTHGNFYSNVEAAMSVMPIEPEESFLSFLPLSHSLERMAGHFTPMHIGATISYAESIDAIRSNLQEVQPTAMISVPRIYEKFHAAIMGKIESGGTVKRKLFAWAMKVGIEHSQRKIAKKGISFLLQKQYDLADALVFTKIKANLGGKLRYAISGGAPLSPELFEFFWAMGMEIYEGYGLTETSPVIAANTPDAVRRGTVGKVLPGVTVKIADDGEILCKGPNVMKGYYKMDEATAEAIVDGWFYTGDIGELDADGFLTITDRKKDLIITAGGKNVAPQNIENMLKLDRFIEQVNIVGDRRKYLTAIIAPAFPELEDFARDKGLTYTSNEELVALPAVRELMQQAIDRVNQELAKYETIKKFYISPVVFTQENNMITPTMKVKRKKVTVFFAKEIEAMYEE